MKHILILVCIFCTHIVHAQSGCTDTDAANFSPTALKNDGSCTYLPRTVSFSLKGLLPDIIKESSGLAYFNGDILTHNDSGNSAEIFVIDSSNGNLKQTISIDNYSNIDWEDICVDLDYIYVGDFGNNDGNRHDLKILKIKRSDITSATNLHVNAEAIYFSYADQSLYASNSSNNFDCEAFFSMGDSLYLFTKNRGDGKTRVYKTSKIPATYILSYYTEYPVNGLITGADYNPSTKEAILIGYDLNKFSSFIWRLSDFINNDFFGGNKRKFIASNFHYWQTEGIAFDTINNKVFISCESAGFSKASLFTLNPMNYLLTSIEQPTNTTQVVLFPNPATEYIYITHSETILDIVIFDMMGNALYNTPILANSYKLQLDRVKFVDGLYYIQIRGNKYLSQQKIILQH